MALGIRVDRRNRATRVRIFLVDDSAEFLESAKRFLGTSQEFEVIGSARSGQEAMRQAAALCPDLMLIDLAMPGMSGLETTRLIKTRADAPQIVIMTLHDNAEYREAARSVAADGFIAKSAIHAQLFSLIAELFSHND